MCILNIHHDEEDRRRWQNPGEILANIGLRSGSTFVDVGCGDGFFAIPAAKLVGEQGKVYGLDISDEALSRLKRRAAREGLGNLSVELGAAEKTVLCNKCADIVFFGIVLHDFKYLDKVLKNARKMLKHSGRLVNLDWKKEPMNLGPPLRIRFSKKEAMHFLEDADFKIETVKDIGPYSYLIIAKP